MSKLYVIGDSFATNYNIDSKCWPELLAERLDMPLVNKSYPAVCNTYIYEQTMTIKPKPTDIIIVGWTHPARKSFEFNPSNPVHMNLEADEIMRYSKFFRSKGSSTPIGKLKKGMYQVSKGIQYFDRYFKDYHSEYENRLNFQAYRDSITLKYPQAVHYYFSEESVDSDTGFYILDYTLKNKLYLSETDYHPSPEGHEKIAIEMYKKLNIQYA